MKKNKIIIAIIELLSAVVITFAFSNLFHISNFKYSILILVIFSVIIYFYNTKKLLYAVKNYLKLFIITFVFSSLCLPLCIDAFIYKTSYLVIEPIKNEQIDKSNEIWIYGISINDKDVKFKKIKNNSWKETGDYIVYSGNKYNSLKIRIRNKIKNIKVKYAKADNLSTMFKINDKIYDTYSDKWELETIKIKDVVQEKKDIINTSFSIISYYLFGIILSIFVYPFSQRKKYRNIIIISFIYLYSVYYYNSIFSITGIIVLILFYALLRNWSVANEENN